MKEFKTKPLIGVDDLGDEKYSIQQLNRIDNGKNFCVSTQANFNSRSKGGIKNKETGHISNLGKKYGAINALKGGTTQKIRLMGAKAMAVKYSKVVLQYTKDGELIKEWNSLNDAKRAGYVISSISRCCNNKLKSTQGFVWKYKQ
jgi:hypothetical protein